MHGACLFCETVDKRPADRFALCLGICETFQSSEKSIGGVDADQGYIELTMKYGFDKITLAFSQKTGIHKGTCESLSDRAVHQCGGDGAVDTA